jgi:hypothetical protein
MFCNACRDHEVLNHQMLLTLIEKVNGMVDCPWYILPEEVGENSIMNTSITREI